MKKWQLIALISFLLLLAVRGAYLLFHRANDEKQWYVENLHLHFSVTVDSMWVFTKVNGLVRFRVTGGAYTPFTEEKVNQKLKHNRSLRFVIKMKGDKLAFHSRDLDKYNVGDSLVINTDDDKITIFRQGKFMAKSAVSQALSGRMF